MTPVFDTRRGGPGRPRDTVAGTRMSGGAGLASGAGRFAGRLAGRIAGPVARLTLVVLGATLLAGCGRTGGGDALFPLDTGRTWTYRAVTERGEVSKVERITVENRGMVQLTETVRAHERWNSLGNRYYLVDDADGIWRAGVRTDVEYGVRLDEGPARRWVLRKPVTAGTTWKAPTHLFMLRRQFDKPDDVNQRARQVMMTFTIESVDEKVTVPAGSFERCVKVAGELQYRVYADPAVGPEDLPVLQREWYCPGTGLVKFERTETIKGKFLNGGAFRMELLKATG